MAYRTMRSVFHEGKSSVDDELSRRLSLLETRSLGFVFDKDELFFTLTSDVYELLLKAARLDKEILTLSSSLPGSALASYTESTLIDEIVLTNKIEGVHSSQKEISEVLASLEKNDRKGRFYGLVQKYMFLSCGKTIPLATCQDIRTLYNDLVLDEVLSSEPKNAPDGILFRANTVDVCDGSGKTIHSGVYPEERILFTLDKALRVLNDASIDALVRVAVFHYLFGYIHPFYDGNGRISRFISSYVIAQNYEPIVALRLSYAIKENTAKYYNAYSVCEHKLNRGDLTPFVIAFCEITINAMESIRDSLTEKRVQLFHFEERLNHLSEVSDKDTLDVANALVTGTLFSTYGMTQTQLCELFNVSRQTIYKRANSLKKIGLLEQSQVGRRVYYTLNLEVLDGVSSS